ncbi:MAG: flagellar export protein FliJ [Bacteriovoracaceae bacterium]|jgi:flagellar protein FliJ|nr:flagellar export protein FliJ [Bacteriovoracaceae bacterium]
MARFKFKLDGLLKLREFKENQLKVELGKLLQEIEETKSIILQLNIDLDEGYDAHSKVLYSGPGVKMLQFFPEYFQGKREDIKNKENLIHALNKKMEAKREELALARGEVKIVENLKEKKMIQFTKEKNKKDMEKIEDQLSMTRSSERNNI